MEVEEGLASLHTYFSKKSKKFHFLFETLQSPTFSFQFLCNKVPFKNPVAHYR